MEKVSPRSSGPIDVEIGARIRDRRKGLGMSQSFLAEQTGVTFQQVQKYERGTNRVSAPALIKIANTLSCRVGELLGERDEPGLDGLNGAAPGSLELLDLYVGLNENSRAALLQVARALRTGAGSVPCVSSMGASRAKSGRATANQ